MAPLAELSSGASPLAVLTMALEAFAQPSPLP